MSKADEELNRLAMQAQLLQREGQILQGQIDIMESTVRDLNATIDSLKNLKLAKDKAILPIGSGAYIACKEVDINSVLISVGAGIIMKKDAKEAISILEDRLKNVNASFEKAQRNLINVNERIQGINAKASVLATRMENVQPTQE
ncbi:MAG: prefoldin subunit alpha [Candidatus Micrarchaeota archaeon]